ncbi:MAG TPA: HAD family hydrolase [Candidatus Saccharimonadales bacterium]|nr:HAD family hydrolase [Candidatus Saccharimonadales bacterium]
MSFHLYPVAADAITNDTLTDKVVVLDLDSTLIHTQENFEDSKKLNIINDPTLMALKRRCYFFKLTEFEKNGEGTRYDYWGIKRHHLDEFLLFCFNYFKIVIVWSAGTKNYVHAIVNTIFKNLKMPHIIWTKDDTEYEDKNVIKDLTKLIKTIDNAAIKPYLKLEKMIVIDDNETTFSKNKKNAVYIPPYDPLPKLSDLNKSDTALLQIKYWLLLPHVMYSDNVTKLDLTSIFKYTHDDYKNIANSYYDDVN